MQLYFTIGTSLSYYKGNLDSVSLENTAFKFLSGLSILIKNYITGNNILTEKFKKEKL